METRRKQEDRGRRRYRERQQESMTRKAKQEEDDSESVARIKRQSTSGKTDSFVQHRQREMTEEVVTEEAVRGQTHSDAKVQRYKDTKIHGTCKVSDETKHRKCQRCVRACVCLLLQ